MTLLELEAALRAAEVRHIRASLTHDGTWRVSGVHWHGQKVQQLEARAASLHDAMAEFLDACRVAAGKGQAA